MINLNQNIEEIKAPKGLLAIIGMLVIYFLPMVLMSVLFLIIFLLNLEIDFSSLFIYLMYSISCWITFLTILMLLRKQGLHLKNIGYRGSMNLLNVGISIVFFVAGLIILTISSILLDYLGIYWSSSLELFTISNALDFVLVVFTLIITAPIIEDTFYRAYSITTLKRKLRNQWIAGLLSCILFAFVHLPFWGIRGSILLFLWASLSMALFIWRKSIYPCLLMHVANNIFMYILIPMLS